MLSFLALGRTCRRCGGPISWRYFWVELLTGLVFVAVWEAAQGRPEVIAWWIFASVVMAVIFTDLDHMIIPDKLVVAGLVAAVLSEAIQVAGGQPLLSVRIPGTSLGLPRVVAGGIVGYAVFVVIRGFSQLLFRREGMGLGDVKLAGAIGAMLGPKLALLGFGLAIVAGAVLGIGLIVLKLRRRMEYLPFGPFLAVAALAVLLAPAPIEQGAATLYREWAQLLGG
jgi:leader peptidase (prepilin peptidase)/N-methyltransferase